MQTSDMWNSLIRTVLNKKITCDFHDPSYCVSIITILHILQGVCKLMSTTIYCAPPVWYKKIIPYRINQNHKYTMLPFNTTLYWILLLTKATRSMFKEINCIRKTFLAMFRQSSALWWWLCVWPPHCFYKYVHFHEKTHRKCRQSVSMAVWADWQRACMSKERFLTKTPQVSYVV